MNRVIGESGNWVIESGIGLRCRRSAINSPITRLSSHPIGEAAGFTMIELLVVLSLIVILATIGMSQYRTSVIHAREAVLKEDLFRMRDAIDQYYADKNQYPSTLDALVSDGYMLQVPEDPSTRSK